MRVARSRAVLALVAWTLLIWVTRIRNVWGDDDLDTAARWGNTALAASFVGIALAVVGFARWGSGSAASRTVRALAGWTVGVWLVRSAEILLDDWTVGFKLVHTALAAVSIALALLATRATGPLHAPPSPTPEPASSTAANPRS